MEFSLPPISHYLLSQDEMERKNSNMCRNIQREVERDINCFRQNVSLLVRAIEFPLYWRTEYESQKAGISVQSKPESIRSKYWLNFLSSREFDMLSCFLKSDSSSPYLSKLSDLQALRRSFPTLTIPTPRQTLQSLRIPASDPPFSMLISVAPFVHFATGVSQSRPFTQWRSAWRQDCQLKATRANSEKDSRSPYFSHLQGILDCDASQRDQSNERTATETEMIKQNPFFVSTKLPSLPQFFLLSANSYDSLETLSEADLMSLITEYSTLCVMTLVDSLVRKIYDFSRIDQLVSNLDVLARSAVIYQASRQQHGTCYAHATAGVVLAALMRRVGSRLPSMQQIVDEAIALAAEMDRQNERKFAKVMVERDGRWIAVEAEGYHGGTDAVLKEICRRYRLSTSPCCNTSALSALKAGRSLYGVFGGDKSFWNKFYNYKGGILDDISAGAKDDGYHAVLVYSEGFDMKGDTFFACRNSWGDENTRVLKPDGSGYQGLTDGFGEGISLEYTPDEPPQTSWFSTAPQKRGYFRTGSKFPWDKLTDILFVVEDCTEEERLAFTTHLKNEDRIIYFEFHMKSYFTVPEWNPTDLRGTRITTFTCPIGITVNSKHSGRRSETISKRTYHEQLNMCITSYSYQTACEKETQRTILSYLELVLTGRYPETKAPVKECFRYGILRKDDKISTGNFGIEELFQLPIVLQNLLNNVTPTPPPPAPVDNGGGCSCS